jgi:CheY-like chemotaxis protein/HPt (histidine-containing phosphotransfer) domain-containing protein
MHVINYVLDVSKMEASDAEITPESFVLAELVDSVLEIVEARAREKGLGLSVSVGPGLSRSYLGDAPRLRQTLLNLVTNAINFTDEGQVSVDLATAEGSPPRVRIDISDTGVGIPEAMQGRVFEPFFSATDSVMGHRDPGTGLGLDIVRRNVSLMGGDLELVSAPGEGSTFSILLPLSPVEEPAEDASLVTETEAAAGPLRGSVLLVDDNRTNLMLGTMLLENLGLRVQGAASGEEAVEAVAKQCFCAVLMDISMPGIDGLEATRRIRGLPNRRNLPVIALTAYASSREQARAREAGMNDYLTKPVDRAELVQVLGKWLPAPMGPPRKRSADRAPTLIDDAILEGLLQEIGPDNFTRVVDTFSQEARLRWQTLVSARSATDAAREAHSLLSTCRSFGLKDVAESLAAIEARARQGLSEDAGSLEAVGQRLEDALNALSGWQLPQHGAA